MGLWGEWSRAAANGLIKRPLGVYGSAMEMGGTGLEPVTPSLSTTRLAAKYTGQLRAGVGGQAVCLRRDGR